MASLSTAMLSTALLPRKPAAVSATGLRTLPNFKQAALFGVRTGGAGGRVKCMATYNVKLVCPEGEFEFECPDDQYILDWAENKELPVELPYSCRAGSCVSCVGKIVSGTVDQSDQSFLEDEQVAEGWVLTCVAYPTSDVVIATHMDEQFNG